MILLLLSSQFFFDASATITELKDLTFTSHLDDITVSGELNEFIITNCTFRGINYGDNVVAFKAKIISTSKSKLTIITVHQLILVQDQKEMMNKLMKGNVHVLKDIIHLVVFAKIQMILIASVLLIMNSFAHVVGVIMIYIVGDSSSYQSLTMIHCNFKGLVIVNDCTFKDANSYWSPIEITNCSSISVKNSKFERLQSSQGSAGALNIDRYLTNIEITGNIFEESQIKIDNNIINSCKGNWTGGISIKAEQYFKSKFEGSISNQPETVYYRISDITFGWISLNQGIKTCTGGSNQEPTPKGCICQLSQSEQECACQENDLRQSCICLIVGDNRPHCIGITIQCNQATSEQLIDASTDICECYEVGDPRDQCSNKTCDDPSSDLIDIPISLCECDDDDDPRRGITCAVTTQCTSNSVSPKCLCTSEHQSPGCICTQSFHPQQCECDNSLNALFSYNICLSTKTCSGSEDYDEYIYERQCTCGEGHHPFDCLWSRYYWGTNIDSLES
ncbi:MAG: hypothetical protein EZS28_019689 [Streblomastix strix]|uniref:EGF-like domain-containing protein n=1 Tax=Streblomastix strix TaxID=222440 RepID=A0A5J4VQC8_9EUKA|nr:MAG: hypothetical protein EZS28_019689 [Streblomastix strix]